MEYTTIKNGNGNVEDNDLLCTQKNHDKPTFIFLKHNKICIQKEGTQYIAMDNALISYTLKMQMWTHFMIY